MKKWNRCIRKDTAAERSEKSLDLQTNRSKNVCEGQDAKLKKSNVATSLDDGDLFKSIKNINLSAGKAATFVLLMN